MNNLESFLVTVALAMWLGLVLSLILLKDVEDKVLHLEYDLWEVCQEVEHEVCE